MLLGHGAEILSGAWFYEGGFVISNILFIGLAAALFVTQERRKLSSVVSIIVFLHVLSWFVMFVFSGKPAQVAHLKIGYYVWFIAYALLIAAHYGISQPSRLDQFTLRVQSYKPRMTQQYGVAEAQEDLAHARFS